MAPSTPRRILVVEDNAALARTLCRHIEHHSPHAAYAVGNGHEAVERIQQDNPLLTVLDIGLPGIDGFEVCRRVRPGYQGPILFLTGEKKEQAQLEGFQSGGDDYVIKPSSFNLIMARIEALIRRASIEPKVTHTTSGVGELEQLDPIQVGRLTIDPVWHKVTTADGQEVSLTPSEVYLTWLLGRAEGKPVTRQEICQALKGEKWDGKSRLPDAFVSKIRKKLAKLKGKPVKIESAQGIGYAMVVRQ